MRLKQVPLHKFRKYQQNTILSIGLGSPMAEKPKRNDIMQYIDTLATNQSIRSKMESETGTHKFERMVLAPRASPEPGYKLMDLSAVALGRPLSNGNNECRRSGQRLRLECWGLQRSAPCKFVP